VSPEQGQRPKWLADGCAHAGRHAAVTRTRAWHLGRLILAAGRGSCPALAATVGGTAYVASAPTVAAGPRLTQLADFAAWAMPLPGSAKPPMPSLPTAISHNGQLSTDGS
jgi:hypothetical protein